MIEHHLFSIIESDNNAIRLSITHGDVITDLLHMRFQNRIMGVPLDTNIIINLRLYRTN